MIGLLLDHMYWKHEITVIEIAFWLLNLLELNFGYMVLNPSYHINFKSLSAYST